MHKEPYLGSFLVNVELDIKVKSTSLEAPFIPNCALEVC